MYAWNFLHHQFLAVTPRVQMCSACMLDFHFPARWSNALSRDCIKVLPKGWWYSVESVANVVHPQAEIEKIWWIVMEEIDHRVEIRTGSVHSILPEDLCMQRVLAKFNFSFCPHNPRFSVQEQHTTCLTGSLLSMLKTTLKTEVIWATKRNYGKSDSGAP